MANFAREAAGVLNAVADSLEADPSGAAVEGALAAAAQTFIDTLQPPDVVLAPAAPPAAVIPPTVTPPASGSNGTGEGGDAPTATTDEEPVPSAAEVSATPTLYKCPQCGAYFTAPATCSNQHPPAETVTLAEVPAPPQLEPPAVEVAAPAAGPGSPDWPAGS